MFILQGIISGLLATIIFDIYQISLAYSYNVNKSKWNLVGRYFSGLRYLKYFREDLENENEIKYEIYIGYLVHYLI